MEKEPLYNPIYIKAEPEYFPGFGKKELHKTAVMIGIVVFFSIILWIILGDIAVSVLTIMIGVTGSIIVNTKNEANLSIVTFIGLFIRYMKQQQRFFYKYQDEWKI